MEDGGRWHKGQWSSVPAAAFVLDPKIFSFFAPFSPSWEGPLFLCRKEQKFLSAPSSTSSLPVPSLFPRLRPLPPEADREPKLAELDGVKNSRPSRSPSLLHGSKIKRVACGFTSFGGTWAIFHVYCSQRKIVHKDC